MGLGICNETGLNGRSKVPRPGDSRNAPARYGNGGGREGAVTVERCCETQRGEAHKPWASQIIEDSLDVGSTGSTAARKGCKQGRRNGPQPPVAECGTIAAIIANPEIAARIGCEQIGLRRDKRELGSIGAIAIRAAVGNECKQSGFRYVAPHLATTGEIAGNSEVQGACSVRSDTRVHSAGEAVIDRDGVATACAGRAGCIENHRQGVARRNVEVGANEGECARGVALRRVAYALYYLSRANARVQNPFDVAVLEESNIEASIRPYRQSSWLIAVQPGGRGNEFIRTRKSASVWIDHRAQHPTRN